MNVGKYCANNRNEMSLSFQRLFSAMVTGHMDKLSHRVGRSQNVALGAAIGISMAPRSYLYESVFSFLEKW